MTDSRLRPRTTSGPAAGLSNLLRAEISSWTRTGRWWKYSLAWILLTNGVVFLLPAVESAAGVKTDRFTASVEGFLSMGALVASIGVILLMQDAVIGERDRGTLSWLFSHPVSRTSFVLSRAIGASSGFLLTAALIPGIVAYGQIALLSGRTPAAVWFAGAVAMLGLQLVFYVTLMLLLGTVFGQRLMVAGSALVFLLAGSSLVPVVAPQLTRVLPLQIPQIGLAMVLAEQLPPGIFVPVAATALWAVVLLALAALRFGAMEL